MRIALFGGSFDPPHRGHLAIAKAAADAFALDRVLFAPTGLQPLKLGTEPTPFATRLKLVELACQSDPRFEVSDIDAPRADDTPNYTVDTLAALRTALDVPRTTQHPHSGFGSDSEATLFNLVGADSFLNLHHWRSPDRLLELAEWIVVTRPGYPLTEPDLIPLGLTAAQRARVHVLAGVAEDVSATALRERLRQGDPCDDLLPEPVAAYIAEHHIYP